MNQSGKVNQSLATSLAGCVTGTSCFLLTVRSSQQLVTPANRCEELYIALACRQLCMNFTSTVGRMWANVDCCPWGSWCHSVKAAWSIISLLPLNSCAQWTPVSVERASKDKVHLQHLPYSPKCVKLVLSCATSSQTCLGFVPGCWSRMSAPYVWTVSSLLDIAGLWSSQVLLTEYMNMYSITWKTGHTL